MQAAIENVLQHLGPMLAEALIYNIGGHASRSELDKLSDPLKKLVTRQVRSKSWLQAALLGSNFPSAKVTVKEKEIFLQKLMKYVLQYFQGKCIANRTLVFVVLEGLISSCESSG
jgi:hypothetical protein